MRRGVSILLPLLWKKNMLKFVYHLKNFFFFFFFFFLARSKDLRRIFFLEKIAHVRHCLIVHWVIIFFKIFKKTSLPNCKSVRDLTFETMFTTCQISRVLCHLSRVICLVIIIIIFFYNNKYNWTKSWS